MRVSVPSWFSASPLVGRRTRRGPRAALIGALFAACAGCAGSSDVAAYEPDVRVTVLYSDAAFIEDSRPDSADANRPPPTRAADATVEDALSAQDGPAEAAVADDAALPFAPDSGSPKPDGAADDASAPSEPDRDGAARHDASMDARDVCNADCTSPDAALVDAAACVSAVTPPLAPRSARSRGYSGTAQAYDALSSVACAGALQTEECASTCTRAGGSAESCRQGSRCEQGGGAYHCAPPAYWQDCALALASDANEATDAAPPSGVDAASDPGDASANGTKRARISVAQVPYADGLLVTDFGAQIPSDATITGVEFRMVRTADVDNAVFDETNLVVQGIPVGEPRIGSLAWSSSRTAVAYGGPDDIWEIDLTPGLVNAAAFGVAIAPRYAFGSGSANAYFYQVRMVVHYQQGCQGRDR